MVNAGKAFFAIIWLIMGLTFSVLGYNYGWLTMFLTPIQQTGSPLMLILYWGGLVIMWLTLTIIAPIYTINRAMTEGRN